MRPCNVLVSAKSFSLKHFQSNFKPNEIILNEHSLKWKMDQNTPIFFIRDVTMAKRASHSFVETSGNRIAALYLKLSVFIT